MANGSRAYGLVVDDAQRVRYAMKGNYIDRDTRQNGCGWRYGEMYTLDATDRHGVVYPETARTLTAEHDGGWCPDKWPNVVCYGVDCRNGVLDEEKTHTIQGKGNGNGISLNCTPSVCYALSVFTKGRRARDKNDYETWMCRTAANTLNTFENSDVRATTVVVRRNDE